MACVRETKMRKRIETATASFPQRVDQEPTNPSGIAELLATLPVRVPRDEAARLIGRLFFQVSPRTLERWPVTWRHLNNRAHVEVAELFAVAQRMLDEAPPVRGGANTALQPKAA
jgi:hypothetical protein